METGKTRNPGTAAVLSFVYNGLGQIYNGQISKGLAIICLTTGCIFLIIVGGVLAAYALYLRLIPSNMLLWGIIFFVVGVLTAVVVGLYSIYDAYNYNIKK